MLNQETIEDCLIPHTQEILDSAWMQRQLDIKTDLQAKSEAYITQLNADTDAFLKTKKKALMDEAEAHLQNFELELNTKTEDEVQRLKNKYKTTIQTAKDDGETHALSLAICTPKAAKPSPLNISKPRKKKKKVTILDLTTPPSGQEAQEISNENSDTHTDMETDADSTPTTPICRSSAPSPAPCLM